MPIMDAQLLFGEAIDCGSTSASAGVLSTNNVYIPKVKDHKGSSVNDSPFNNGENFLNITTEDEAFATASGSAVVTVTCRNHTAAITASNLASTDTILTKTMTVDASGANYPDGGPICSLGLPLGQLKPYFVVYFAVATKKVTAGKATAWIGPPTQLGQ